MCVGGQTWTGCAVKCSEDPACTDWVWHHENAGPWAFFCITMSGWEWVFLKDYIYKLYCQTENNSKLNFSSLER